MNLVERVSEGKIPDIFVLIISKLSDSIVNIMIDYKIVNVVIFGGILSFLILLIPNKAKERYKHTFNGIVVICFLILVPWFTYFEIKRSAPIFNASLTVTPEVCQYLLSEKYLIQCALNKPTITKNNIDIVSHDESLYTIKYENSLGKIVTLSINSQYVLGFSRPSTSK